MELLDSLQSCWKIASRNQDHVKNLAHARDDVGMGSAGFRPKIRVHT
jgi:hypothetical protein